MMQRFYETCLTWSSRGMTHACIYTEWVRYWVSIPD